MVFKGTDGGTGVGDTQRGPLEQAVASGELVQGERLVLIIWFGRAHPAIISIRCHREDDDCSSWREQSRSSKRACVWSGRGPPTNDNGSRFTVVGLGPVVILPPRLTRNWSGQVESIILWIIYLSILRCNARFRCGAGTIDRFTPDNNCFCCCTAVTVTTISNVSNLHRTLYRF